MADVKGHLSWNVDALQTISKVIKYQTILFFHSNSYRK